MLRRWLAKAGVPGRPILDWAHLARRVQAAKTTDKGLQVLTGREYRPTGDPGPADAHRGQ